MEALRLSAAPLRPRSVGGGDAAMFAPPKTQLRLHLGGSTLAETSAMAASIRRPRLPQALDVAPSCCASRGPAYGEGSLRHGLAGREADVRVQTPQTAGAAILTIGAFCGWRARGRQRVRRRRHSFEPFGGVYARDWALEPTRRSLRWPLWAWLLATFVALYAAWAVAGNWTDALVFLCTVSFIAQCYYPSWEDEGVLTPDAVTDASQRHRLFLTAFLHASWYHLGANMFSLWYLGHWLERAVGPGRFIFIYLGSAIIGSLVSVTWKRMNRETTPSVGASASIFGMHAAVAVMRLRRGFSLHDSWQLLLVNLAVGVLSPGVDNAGHVGGAFGGALIAHLWGPRYTFMLGGLVARDQPIIAWPFC